MRRVLYVAMTRARTGLVLAWPESEGARPSPFLDDVARAAEVPEQFKEEELFGPSTRTSTSRRRSSAISSS
jgi:ATP-dependent exoDNAse (exonuclease V) beta subunit